VTGVEDRKSGKGHGVHDFGGERMMTCLRTLVALFLSMAPLPAVAVQERSPAAAGMVVRIASISFVPTKFDLQRNSDQLEQLFRQAAAGGAKIAVAPEGALEGYVVNEIIEGRAPQSRMRDVAIPIGHPVIERFRRLAAELGICLIFGFAERVDDDVFNCAVFIDGTGTIRGKQHKMQLAEGYDEAWWFNRLGAASRAFDTPYGRAGILICNDRWNPDLARILVLDGARFLLIPSYGSKSSDQDQAVLSRARENSVPVVEANVGVTLVVDKGEIVSIDRNDATVTFGEITIPAATGVDAAERDRVERRFLEWRTQEMSRRLEKTREKVNSKGAPRGERRQP
jgi:N-carbamoylputrescine amidase